MKKIATILSLMLITSTVFAADVQVTPCSKNPKVLLVEISGESATNIFRALALRIGLKPAEMLNSASNNMFCNGLKFSQDGDVTEATCSYVMIGQSNIAYPQIDPGFSRENVIICN